MKAVPVPAGMQDRSSRRKQERLSRRKIQDPEPGTDPPREGEEEPLQEKRRLLLLCCWPGPASVLSQPRETQIYANEMLAHPPIPCLGGRSGRSKARERTQTDGWRCSRVMQAGGRGERGCCCSIGEEGGGGWQAETGSRSHWGACSEGSDHQPWPAALHR